MTKSTFTPSCGYHVIIDTSDDYTIRYLHFKSQSPLSINSTVSKLNLVGYVGNTGDGRGYHLHFDVNNGTEYVQPVDFFSNNVDFQYRY